MKKINWKHILILLILIVIGSAILIYRIGDQYFWTDEVFSFNAAKRLIETGSTTYASGLEYPRSSIYHQLLAWSMQLFGENEFGSRIINIPFIIGSAILAFLFVKEGIKNKKHAFNLGLLTAGIYITTNLSIALARETRMYPMLVFFCILAIYAFHKAIVKPKKHLDLKIKNLRFEVNISWSIISLASLYIAYDTHPISLVLGLGILIYFILAFTLNKKKEYLFYITGLIIAALVLMIFRYGSINIYDIFINLSPDWAQDPPHILLYPLLLVKSLPGIFIFSPIILLSIYKYKKEPDILLFSIFMTFLIFLSLQKAQPERYMQPAIPILISLFILSIYRFLQDLPNLKTKKLFLAMIIIIAGILHTFLFQKEIREINNYTLISVSIHKKMNFQSIFEYLDEKNLNDYIVIADYHAAFTLYERGYKIDYLLIEPDSQLIQNGETEEPYFNMPYLIYGTDFEKTVENKPRIVILRDSENYPDIEKIVTELKGYTKPQVYR
jgi:4-amino-4-deoxy-L-arabinose transferase-like glycosyltransferase